MEGWEHMEVLGSGHSLETCKQIRYSVTETKATGILDLGANNLEHRTLPENKHWYLTVQPK